MSRETAAGKAVVSTTGVHLARRLGDALHQAYQGQLDVKYSADESFYAFSGPGDVPESLSQEVPGMPWSSEDFPPTMDRLPVAVRAKAIEIANALLEEGHDDGFAIRVAIARAKQWAQRLGVDDSS